MNYLLPGHEPAAKIRIVIALTRMTSQPQIDALTEHYVNGLPTERAAARFGIDLANFTRAQKRLEEVAEQIEKVKEIDWQRFGYSSQNPIATCQLTDNRTGKSA
ncbi:hypothetical protein [Shewanella sp. Isolate11]|uniref:hypothetical protein n=1 Tax=Shewanella sp. Isolate11 TaxID=2908530 RepID=UPI001EFCA3DC|nr:hypothetical protein [Shewanella sp. Isolate11]MCG9697455.1 hypothetical protein [Shewanella sp. Isolate11]